MSTSVGFRNSALIVVCVMATCVTGAFGAVPVVINEVLASNGHGATDPQGEYDDWIELYNGGAAAVNLAGMYLTDDEAEPTKWQFPQTGAALTTIPAHGYLLVWADNEVTDAGLHAAFKLSAGGDTVALFDKDGKTLIDSVSFDGQRTDVSYGRPPEAADTWAFLFFPTPGAPNLNIYQGIVDKPLFSVPHGFYTGEVQVSITCATPGALIYYTTDGSLPYLANGLRPGSTARVYAGPIRISTTTCLRAVAGKVGWYPSSAETSTYLFVADVITQSPTGAKPGPAWPSSGVNGQMIDYGMDPDVVNSSRYKNLVGDALLAIPSVSLATDLANLFDSQTGIYVHARSLGQAWERPVSAELIWPDGTEGFQIDAGLRIRGGYSRSGGNPKHAFRLFFGPDYGPASLQYALFGAEGVDEFDCVDLRTSQNYSWSYEGGNSNSHDTFVREVFSRDTQRDMGQPYTRSRYYHLYLDGQYWGLYQTQERSEASYAASYFGGDKDDYDVIKSRAGNGGYDIEATDGTLDNWRLLWNAAGSGFSSDATYYRVQGLNPDRTPNPGYPKLLDVDNLIDYMLCTYYVGDPDGPVSAWALVANNFYAIYNRVHPDGFKFFRHDAEHSLDNLQENRLFASTTVAVGGSFNQSNPLWMHTHLMAHPEYRLRFADRVYKHFFNGGVLTPEACIERFSARMHQIETAIIAESARWGDAKRGTPRTRDDDWLPDMNRMISNYFPARTDVVFNQFKAQGWWPGVEPPTMNTHGGHVATGFSLQMNASSGTIYYTLDGTDPRIPGTAPSTGSVMTLVTENAAKRVLVPTGPVSDAWRTDSGFNDAAWLSGSGGVGYERSSGYETLFRIDVGSQMYGRATTCYVRIPFTITADGLQGLASLMLKVRYDDGFVAYLNGVEVQRVFCNGTPAWNSAASSTHSDIDAVNLESFDVSSHIGALHAGTNLLAIHALNESTTSSDFLLSVELSAARGATGGTPSGVSLTAIRYTGPITLTRSTQVKSRVLSGTTWSALNEAVFAVGPVAQSLRVSELMYHPLDTGNPDDPNTEFIELNNIASQSINLNLVRFTRGIDYTFPSFDLPAGGYCLVAKDLAAFQAKYGSTLPVVGQYAGSLDNGGERIELVDAAGTIIQSFQYDDKWFKTTDGQGYSLTVKDPKTTDANSLNDKNAWQPSVEKDGSPGRVGP